MTRPLGVCLDLHANLTVRMVELADVMVGYHTEPHVDMGSTGERIARLVAATVRSEISPAMALAKRSLLIPAEGMRTDLGPMSEVRELADRMTVDRVLDISLFPVQPWLDVPELGLGVLVVTDDDPEGASSLAKEFAYEVWRRRGRMTTPRIMTPSAGFCDGAAFFDPAVFDGAHRRLPHGRGFRRRSGNGDRGRVVRG